MIHKLPLAGSVFWVIQDPTSQMKKNCKACKYTYGVTPPQYNTNMQCIKGFPLFFASHFTFLHSKVALHSLESLFQEYTHIHLFLFGLEPLAGRI